MNQFKGLWRTAAAFTLMLAGVAAMAGAFIATHQTWGLAAGMVLGVADLVGLGLRLPLWARLNPRAAVMSVNLRLFSRFLLLGVSFYVLHRYTRVSIPWALVGVFVPYGVYLVKALIGHRSKGVNG